MTPGVQGAVFRGKTALVLTHCNGLFAWCVTFIISCFCCLLDHVLSHISYQNIQSNKIIFHLLLSRENKSTGGDIVHFSLIGSHSNNAQRGECLAMHGALVAIGTRSGTVYVYHLDGNWENQVSECNYCVEISRFFYIFVFNKLTCKVKLDLTLRSLSKRSWSI